jgi:hypothetical protein
VAASQAANGSIASAAKLRALRTAHCAAGTAAGRALRGHCAGPGSGGERTCGRADVRDRRQGSRPVAALPMVASAQGGDLPVISWAEFQRRVRVDGEELILVAGCVIDVSELQEGEHKGGAVYNFGADMTNLFMGAHANPPDRPSAHVESLQVVENIQEKVITWTVALLDESTRPTDPALIKVDLDGVAGYTELASSSGEKNLKTIPGGSRPR